MSDNDRLFGGTDGDNEVALFSDHDGTALIIVPGGRLGRKIWKHKDRITVPITEDRELSIHSRKLITGLSVHRMVRRN